MPSTQNTESLKQRIDSLEKTVKGGNGGYGLITDIAVIKASMDTIQRDIDALWNVQRESNALHHEMKETIITINDRITMLSNEIKMNKDEHENIRRQSPDFRWFIEKIFLPILLPLIGSVIGSGIIFNAIVKTIK